MANFVSALNELKEIGDKENRYQDIEEWFKNDGSINDELFKDKDEKKVINKKKIMCKYLLYLFAGALAEDVHIATGNVLHKGLNEKIKDMKGGKFCELLVELTKENTKTKLMNETGAYKWERALVFFAPGPNSRTPSREFNDGIEKVAGTMKDFLNLEQTDSSKQLTNDEFIKKFLDIFNKTRTSIHDAKEFDRCCIKRPGINIARCFKRFLGKQDFSYTNSKYEPVFKPLNLKDANKDKSIEK